MDQKDTSYRAYFVKNDPQACSGTTTGIAASQFQAQGIFTVQGGRILSGQGIIEAEAFDLKGMRAGLWRGEGRSSLDIGALRPGLYSFRVRTRTASAVAVFAKL
jgi:hypothetical protein